VAQVQRNQAKEKKKAANKWKKAPAPINKDTDSEKSFKRVTEGYLYYKKHMIMWYHSTLCHPGIFQTEETIGQHLWWPN
jgi:hypothetical protein